MNVILSAAATIRGKSLALLIALPAFCIAYNLQPFMTDDVEIAANYKSSHPADFDNEYRLSMKKLEQLQAAGDLVGMQVAVRADFEDVPRNEFLTEMRFDHGMKNSYVQSYFAIPGRKLDWQYGMLRLACTKRWGLREEKLLWAILSDSGYRSEAREAWRRSEIETMAGDDPSRLAAYAWALTFSGKDKEAVRIAKRAVQLSKTDADVSRARFALFDAYSITGSWEPEGALWAYVMNYIPPETRAKRIAHTD